LDLTYLDLGGRSPPKRRVGLSAKSFLMRRKGALKKDIAAIPNADLIHD